MNQSLKRKWKIYTIHHSHTDIGYTERQEKIEQFQVDYIRQAIEIAKSVRSGGRPEWKGFKWMCETFWAVERFLEQATDELKAEFASALRQGDIELSGTYLNMTELIDGELLTHMAGRAKAYADRIGIRVDSAMTADINGYSWGYAQAMIDSGIDHLLTSIHTHHGMFALGRKQYPFYWETPAGDRLLVWNGEHYMMGNDLGLNPDSMLSYTIRDEFPVWGVAENHWEVAETRIGRYLQQLEAEAYPYDFVLVNVMGQLRDNAAPNGGVMAFIHEWNGKHGESVEIEMTTLSKFFEHVKKQPREIEVFRGDWPDWWSDGVASTAMHTQIYREAQRMLRVVKRLDPTGEIAGRSLIAEAEQQLIMYAEHTWGYHSSVREPWHPLVQELEVRKQAYAANASRAVWTALDNVTHRKGEALVAAGRPFTYKAINPSGGKAEDLAYIYIEGGWESDLFRGGLEVVDDRTGSVLVHQKESVSKGNQIAVKVALAPGEERTYTLRPAAEARANTAKSTRLEGNDRVYDMNDLIPLPDAFGKQGLSIGESFVESPHARIEWKLGDGIVSWIDKRTGEQLLRSGAPHAAFTPVYEVTPAGNAKEMAEVRRKMGRNRKGMDVRRHAGRLTGAREVANGPLYGTVELLYEVEGCSYYSLFITAYTGMLRVDVSVRMHKNSVWDPENVYVSLPFRSGCGEEQLWVEKAGALVRPGIDQLPGTMLDYYCVQEGLAYVADRGGLVLAAKDTPLIQLGSLEYGTRKVHGQQSEDEFRDLYAWVLTNYWETNFKGTLGGFYEFRYTLQWGAELNSPEAAIAQAHRINEGLVSFRSR
ncbi:glycoside hydrolase family 38 N-terminal domain-containing protein [Paenibacillus arenilitoris]|uniref:glycoside hydrolase family 38 N-terminal domain-containing protein n=1 Tax=Paenibacillus arenilitoris TaxID=2772299 RepID=UPI001CC23427|nr:glycoside hydrolase [Paenibacillus arenilitoris]